MSDLAKRVADDPYAVCELFGNTCPKCGAKGLEALTWENVGSDAVTVGCWECDWLIEPEEAWGAKASDGNLTTE